MSRNEGGRWRVISDNGITSPDGLIVLCRGVARGARIEVAAWRDPKDAIRIQRTIDDPLSVMRIVLPAAIAVVATSSVSTLTVSGSVRDSATGATVANARVTFVGTPFEGQTDIRGTFVVGGLEARGYTVEVSTPAFDSIGVVSRSSHTVSAVLQPITLFAPSLPAILTSACGANDATGFVVGTVSRRGSAVMPNGLRVVAEWEEALPDSVSNSIDASRPATRTAWRDAEVGATGTYRVCGVPSGTRVVLRTEFDTVSRWTASRTVSLFADRRFARIDLQLDSVTTTLATLTGIVVADSTGVPLENAEVNITDLDRTVFTDRRGAFRVSDLPPGAHLLRIQRSGYAILMAPVDIAGDNVVQHRLRLKSVTPLSAVADTADVRGMTEFKEWRNVGIGRFLTRVDFDNTHGRHLGDVTAKVSQFRGVIVGSAHSFAIGAGIRGRRFMCQSTTPACVPGNGNNSSACGEFAEKEAAKIGYYCPTEAEKTDDWHAVLRVIRAGVRRRAAHEQPARD